MKKEMYVCMYCDSCGIYQDEECKIFADKEYAEYYVESMNRILAYGRGCRIQELDSSYVLLTMPVCYTQIKK